jgi:uncharacterized protein YceK
MKIIALLLVVSMLSGCATMRRHPVVTGIIAGAGVGIGVGLATRGHGHCPNTYEGRPYSGTPPCPIEDGK